MSREAKLQVAWGQCTVSKPVHSLPDAYCKVFLHSLMHTLNCKECSLPDAYLKVYLHCLMHFLNCKECTLPDAKYITHNTCIPLCYTIPHISFLTWPHCPRPVEFRLSAPAPFKGWLAFKN